LALALVLAALMLAASAWAALVWAVMIVPVAGLLSLEPLETLLVNYQER